MTKNRGQVEMGQGGTQNCNLSYTITQRTSASNERSHGLAYDRIHSEGTSLDPWIGGNSLVVENTAKEIYREWIPNRFPNSKRNSMEKKRYKTPSQRLIGQQQTLSASV